MKTLSIVIPLYNESTRLKDYMVGFLKNMQKLNRKVNLIFVDDGSTDSTFSVLNSLKKRFLKLDINLIKNEHHGKGYALQKGIANAKYANVLLMDADIPVNFKTLDRFLKTADRENFDLLIGNRIYDYRPTCFRTISANLFVKFRNFLYPELIHTDTQSGIKLLKLDTFKSELNNTIKSAGFVYDVELTLFFIKSNYRIKTTNIKWEFREGSKINFKNGGRAFVDLALLKLRSLSLYS